MKNTYKLRLRAYRKQNGMTQEDMAFLLGLKGRSALPRFERNERYPDIKTALAYRAIFKREIHELFPELETQTKRAVARRRAKLTHVEGQKESEVEADRVKEAEGCKK